MPCTHSFVNVLILLVAAIIYMRLSTELRIISALEALLFPTALVALLLIV